LAAEAALAKGLRRVVVDRAGFQFAGRIKELVEAAVAAGLKITKDDTSAAEVTK
jgi:ribosomal protein L18